MREAEQWDWPLPVSIHRLVVARDLKCLASSLGELFSILSIHLLPPPSYHQCPTKTLAGNPFWAGGEECCFHVHVPCFLLGTPLEGAEELQRRVGDAWP